MVSKLPLLHTPEVEIQLIVHLLIPFIFFLLSSSQIRLYVATHDSVHQDTPHTFILVQQDAKVLKRHYLNVMVMFAMNAAVLNVYQVS